jgi:hypothetical protein
MDTFLGHLGLVPWLRRSTLVPVVWYGVGILIVIVRYLLLRAGSDVYPSHRGHNELFPCPLCQPAHIQGHIQACVYTHTHTHTHTHILVRG